MKSYTIYRWPGVLTNLSRDYRHGMPTWVVRAANIREAYTAINRGQWRDEHTRSGIEEMCRSDQAPKHWRSWKREVVSGA